MEYRRSDTVHDHSGKVFQLNVVVVDELAVGNDLLNLLLAHALTHVDHSVSELLHGDLAVLVSIEDSKGVCNIFQSVRVLSSFSNQIFEAFQVELTRRTGVNFLHHVCDLSLARVKVDSADQSAELWGVHEAIAVLVEEHENFFDLARLNVLIGLLLRCRYHDFSKLNLTN